MSRSGYDEYGDEDHWGMIRWRGAVASAERGKKGQTFFTELAAALDAMPEKMLIKESLADGNGCYCAIGALASTKSISLEGIDSDEDQDVIASRLGINEKLVMETIWQNDDAGSMRETAEGRWTRMREWVNQKIREGEMFREARKQKKVEP